MQKTISVLSTGFITVSVFSLFLFNSCKKSDIDCYDPALVNKNAACTLQYEPVKGCDGKIYGNPCVAMNSGIKSWTPAE